MPENLSVRQVEPVWGATHARGYVGFSYELESFVSWGISVFEWGRGEPDLRAIKVSHCFLVSGPDEVIEASTGGVVRGKLLERFDNPKLQVFFRVPIGWTPEMGEMLVAEAESHLGEKYGYALLVAHALANTRLGRWLNGVTGHWPDRAVSWVFGSKKRKICSQLVAHCLRNVFRAVGQLLGGILVQPERMADPKELFVDEKVFKAWKAQVRAKAESRK